MSTYHVGIEVVEEETPEMWLCRVGPIHGGPKAVWVPKAKLTPGPDGIAIGQCDVQADIDYDVALECGLAEPVLPPVEACRSCRAPMRWCRTPTGKLMPIDAAPVEYGGNIVFRGGLAVTLRKGEPAHAHEKRYVSHFATCKDSAQHRRK